MTDVIRADCRRDYRAYHSSGLRELDDILWVVLHDEEAPTARAAAAYFESPYSGGSAHLCVDDTVCYRTLPNNVIPWGASSAPQLQANLHGFHIEQAGYAKWAPRQWLLHKLTIERAAFKAARHCRLFRLPVVWLDADALVRGAHAHRLPKGITTHREISAASRRLDPEHAWRYTHSDPGLFYPRRRFMQRCAAYYAELA